jgi:hypothetical protein
MKEQGKVVYKKEMCLTRRGNSIADVIPCSFVFVEFFDFPILNWKIIFLTYVDKTEVRKGTEKDYKENCKEK